MICFLDLDGVLCDFTKGALKYHNKEIPYKEIKWNFMDQMEMTQADFWNPLGEEFWANLEPTPEMYPIIRSVYSTFNPQDVFIISSPCLTIGCSTGKAKWVEKHLPGFRTRLILSNRKELFAQSNYVLIDDSDDNCKKWAIAGGMVIKVPRPWNDMNWVDHDKVVQTVEAQLTAMIRKFKGDSCQN